MNLLREGFTQFCCQNATPSRPLHLSPWSTLKRRLQVLPTNEVRWTSSPAKPWQVPTENSNPSSFLLLGWKGALKVSNQHFELRLETNW